MYTNWNIIISIQTIFWVEHIEITMSVRLSICPYFS